MRNVVALLIAATLASPLSAQTLTEPLIESMISCGLGKTKCDSPDIVIIEGGTYGIIVKSPQARIWSAARQAKAEFRPFTRADVTEAMLAPTVHIYASGSTRNMSGIRDVKRIVLRAKDKSIIQPVEETELAVSSRNLMGADITHVNRLAVFNLVDLPVGDFHVLVLMSGNSRTGPITPEYAIKGKNRDKLDQ
jgi:hypothetical protein